MRKIPEVRSSLNCSSDTSHVKLYRLCSHYLFVYCYDNLTTLWLNFHLPTIILSKKVSIYFSLCFIPKKDVASLSHGFSHEFSVHLRSTTFRERWKGAALWGAETADSGALPRSPDALLSNYTYIYIYISISLYLYIYICIFIYLYLYTYIRMSTSPYLSLYLYLYVYVNIDFYISIVYPYIHISISLCL